MMRYRTDPGPCEYCGGEPAPEAGIYYRYECPECGRPGCDECMPAGAECECPECEQGPGADE